VLHGMMIARASIAANAFGKSPPYSGLSEMSARCQLLSMHSKSLASYS
jgi:hypothetical protein